METILLAIGAGSVIGWIVGHIKNKASAMEFNFRSRTVWFFVAGVVFGILGKLGITGMDIFGRILTTAGVVSIFYLSWDYLQAKITR